jgi:hypothetical protein
MALYQYSGSGTLLNSNQSKESKSYSYNQSSELLYTSEDIGSISSGSTSNEEYGFTDSPLTDGEIDYGLISITSGLQPFGGFTLGGSAITSANYRLFFSGSAVEKVIYKPSEGIGTLFNIGQKVEKITYNYNESSTENTEEDYGSITTLTSNSDNYQSISESSSITIDNGFVSELTGGTLVPFGGLTFSGSAITSANYRLFFSGSAIEKIIYSPEGTGSLFGFGQKLESVTYDYNQQSVYVNADDYGLVSEITSGGQDFGLISESGGSQPEENYGLISETVVEITSTPFGGITLSGEGLETIEQEFTYNVSGSLTLSGSLVEKFTSGAGESTQLLQISGTSVEKNAESYVASGTLFSFGEKVERRTYSYNDSVDPLGSDDYGLITEVYSESEDGGLITNSVDAIDNYGSLGVSGGTSVFGSITISGSLIEKFDKGLYSGSGSLTLSGSLVEKFTSGAGESTQLFQISGGNIYSEINSYVASGTLFGFGEKLESVTYDYSLESVVSNTDDYGLISSTSIAALDDYGLITDNSGAIPPENFGLISEPILSATSTPFGTITLSGDAVEVIEKDFTYNASGTLNLSGTITEKFTSGAGEFTQLFQLSGGNVYSEINSYVASGTLFGFGEKLESRTYAYNETSIGSEEDFGNIIDAFTEVDDWGNLNPTSIAENYGTLKTVGGTPFGSIFISGAASDLRETDVYIGSGTVFISAGSSDIIETDSYSGSGLITLSGTALESESESYVGLGTLTLSGTALEAYSAQTPEDTQLFQISGTALEAFSAQTPEDTQLFVISGTALESESESYVGLGTLTLSGTLVEKDTESYVGLGTLTLSGTALEAYSAQTPEDTQLFTISGTALEAFSAQTPEDTQLFVISGTILESETDSYVGLGTLTLSGTLVEKDTESYVGLGTIVLSGVVDDSAQRTFKASGLITISDGVTESFTRFVPIAGVSTNTTGIPTGGIGGTISIFNTFTRYYSPIYPRNAGIPGSGIGTIRVNDDKKLTITRAVLPYFGRGTLVLSGSLNESFTPATHVGVGIVTVSGIAPTREVQVYGYYGDDKDPGTSGKITISEQTKPSIEKKTDSYVGLGTIFINSGVSDVLETDSYVGLGTLTLSGTALESFSAQTPEDTQLFVISGTSFESFTPTTEIGSGIITISGASDTPKKTFGYSGSGSITLSGSSVVSPSLRHIGSGAIRFVPRFRTDDDYITCDSDSSDLFTSPIVSVTCDREDDALVSFVANPPENTVLFNISGNATTRTTSLYQYIGIGNVRLGNGYSDLKATFANIGSGVITLSAISKDRETYAYSGSGSINTLSGSSEVISAQTPENTILLQISGQASTKVEFEYSYSGIGNITLSGFSSERTEINEVGSGVITISGNLVYPDVKFVPSPDGFGTISILGSSDERVAYVDQISGGILFTISGGFESFSRPTYSGIGTIYIESTSGTTVNNPYQPPRLYVTII